MGLYKGTLNHGQRTFCYWRQAWTTGRLSDARINPLLHRTIILGHVCGRRVANVSFAEIATIISQPVGTRLTGAIHVARLGIFSPSARLLSCEVPILPAGVARLVELANRLQKFHEILVFSHPVAGRPVHIRALTGRYDDLASGPVFRTDLDKTNSG